MSADWPRVTLGEVLRKSDDWIPINTEATYAEVTVRLWGKGVALRREVSGAEIAGTTRLRVRPNQFIVSRIDARNGAFGLIPKSLDGAVVTNDFPVFVVDDQRLDPRFLNWMSKTAEFVDLCKAASEGTTNRVRLKEDKFLVTTIPLPPVAEQRRIVARVEAVAARFAEARRLREEATADAHVLLTADRRRVFSGLADSKAHQLAEVCDIIDTLHSDPVYSEEGVPCVRSPDVREGWLELRQALSDCPIWVVRT